MKLLIVDDQITVVEGLLRGIDWNALGFDCVDTAYNAIDARASLLRQEAEVMLCDIEMPVESGLELLKWMRDSGMSTRCIFLTAHARFQYAQETVRLGGFDYIVQPAPYEQVREAAERAIQDVRLERAAREQQSCGVLLDDQKNLITENLVRSYLAASAEEESIGAFEELGLFPRRGRESWLALFQPLHWQPGVPPWELPLLRTAIDNMCREVFAPMRPFCLTVSLPQEQSLAVVLQFGTEPDAQRMQVDDVRRLLGYVQSACEQYLHLTAAFYLAGPEAFAQAADMWRRLQAGRGENVALKGGVYLARRQEAAGPDSFRLPQIAGWKRLILEGYPYAMEQQAVRLLDELAARDRLSRTTLGAFYQDFTQMLLSLQEDSPQLLQNAFRDPRVLELYRNGMRTVDDVKELIHALAAVWDGGQQGEQRNVVDTVCRYIAEHIEEELRREELAEVVHLNSDYLNRLFKKETGLTLKEYVVRQKMQEARSLLRTTSLPVSFIAAKVGYSNFAHFSTSYKKMFNRSPQEERQNAL